MRVLFFHEESIHEVSRRYLEHEYTQTHTHTDEPRPICPLLFQSWGHTQYSKPGPCRLSSRASDRLERGSRVRTPRPPYSVLEQDFLRFPKYWEIPRKNVGREVKQKQQTKHCKLELKKSLNTDSEREDKTKRKNMCFTLVFTIQDNETYI